MTQSTTAPKLVGNKWPEKSTDWIVDKWIEEAHIRGYHVNNLFEVTNIRKTFWRCSLRRLQPQSREDFFEYGDGDTPQEAFRNALYNARIMRTQSYMVARKKVRRST